MKRKKLIVKYCAFNIKTHEFYLCSSKEDMAKCCNTSSRTILRRMAMAKDFIIGDWCISTDIEVIKQPIRNTNSFG